MLTSFQTFSGRESASRVSFFLKAAMASMQEDEIPLAQQTQIEAAEDTDEEVEAEKPRPGDSFLLREAEMLGGMVLCRLCGQRFSPGEVVAKYQSLEAPAATKYRCKKCNSISVMLARRMKWPPNEFSSMNEEEQMEFWKSCHESSDGRFKYEAIRAKLVKKMTHRVTHESSAEEFSEPKPLSVWQAQGYPAKEIAEKGIKTFDAILGWVYEVPQLKKCRRVLMQEIEDRVTEAEQSIKQRVGKNEKAECLESCFEAGGPPAKKLRKGAKTPDEAALAKKQLAEATKHNAKIQSQATKVFNYLSKQMEENKKAAEAVLIHQEKLPVALSAEVADLFGQVSNIFAEASKAVKQAPTAASKGIRLEDLNMDFKQVTVVSNELKTSVKQLNAILRALKLA